MAGGLEDITKRVERLEGTVEAVVASLKELSASVIAGFVEQREYTEFAFQRLDAKIDAGLGQLATKIDTVEGRLDTRIDAVEGRLGTRIDAVEGRLGAKIDGVDGRLAAKIDGVDSRLGAKIDGVDSRLERVERKLDQFIDVQLLANQQTDLRLRTLER